MGLGQEEAQAKFGFLLDAFNYGPPPHGGIAIGWDRTCALLSGTDSIRDVIAFPKSGGGVDPLTDAPAPITAQQRKEAGVDAGAEGIIAATRDQAKGLIRNQLQEGGSVVEELAAERRRAAEAESRE